MPPLSAKKRAGLPNSAFAYMTVHTVARVCSAAHGGQVLISGETKAVAGGSAPTGVRFNSLGRHRLPGIPKAEALFQVEATGLRSRFPPPRTTAAPQPDP